MTDSGRQDTSDQQAPDHAYPHQIEPAPSPAVQVTMDQMTDRLQTVIDAAERAAEAIRVDAEAQARQHLAEAQQKADRLTAERVRLIAELTDDLIDHASVVKQHSEQMVGALEQAIHSVSGRIDEVTAQPVAEPPALEPEPALEIESEPEPAAQIEPEPEPAAAPDPEPLVEPLAAEPAAISGDPQPPMTEPYLEPAPEPEAEPEPQPEHAEEIPPPPPVEAEPSLPDGDSEPDPMPESETLLALPEPPPEALLRATQLAVAGSERADVAEMLTREYGIDPAPVLDRIFGPA